MSDGYGYKVTNDIGTETSNTAFQIERFMAEIRGLMLVKVMKVYEIDGKTTKQTGLLLPSGFVDIQPIVSQVDGQNQKQDHVTIYHIPYMRANGGNSAFIVDPVVGDIGLAIVSDRDISSAKDAVAQQNSGSGSSGSSSSGMTQTYTPNSRRRHDMADCIYITTILSAKPKNFVRLQPGSGVVIGDEFGNRVGMGNTGIVLDPVGGPVLINGNLQVTGSITAGQNTGDQVGLQTHTHGGVTTGAGNTASPNAGT